MALSDDPEIETLFEDLLAKTALAVQADDALNGKVADIAQARQASQDAQVAARVALGAFVNRVATSPALPSGGAEAITRIFGRNILPNIDPDALGKLVTDKAIEVGLVTDKAIEVGLAATAEAAVPLKG